MCRNGALLKDIQNAKDRYTAALSCNKLHVCNTGLYVLAYCPDLANSMQASLSSNLFLCQSLPGLLQAATCRDLPLRLV